MKKVGMLVALIATLGVAPLTVGAAPHGGNGGSPFNLTCSGDEVLVGITVRAGRLVDSVEALCVKVNPNGTWSGGHVARGRAGGSGGSSVMALCDQGSAVTGIHGRAGALVDSVGTQCSKLAGSEGKSTKGPFGGGGGTPFSVDACPGGQVGKGLRGRSGALIDQIDLVCGPSPVQATQAMQQTQRQQAPPRQLQHAPATSSGAAAASNACSVADKLQVASFWATQRGLGLGNVFKMGDLITFTATIRNLCPSGTPALNVPWDISLSDGQYLGQGTVTIGAGSTAEVSGTWTPQLGGWQIFANANLGGTAIAESSHANNTRSISLAPRIVRGPLIAEGSLRQTFAVTPDLSGRSCRTTTVPNIQNNRYSAVEVNVNCGGSVFGARVTVEAFANKTLQNGWKIVSSTVSWTYGGSVGWDVQPAAGGTNLYAKYHIAADSGVEALGSLYITVEGPAGASPGQDMFVIGN